MRTTVTILVEAHLMFYVLWTLKNFFLAAGSRRKKQEFARDFDRYGKKAWREGKTVSRERGTVNMPEKERKGVGNYCSEVRKSSVIFCYF